MANRDVNKLLTEKGRAMEPLVGKEGRNIIPNDIW